MNVPQQPDPAKPARHHSSGTTTAMTLDDDKVVLYRNAPCGWVAEIPSIPGSHALMPTREAALAEVAAVFPMIAEE